MTDRELMQQALKAMGTVGADWICEASHHAKKDQHKLGEPCPLQQRWHIAYQALRERLAQPEQEPVAMRYDFDGYGYRYIDSGSGSNWQTRIKDAEPLYDAPPRREWQGLTLDDMEELTVPKDWIAGARWAEAKLREKNSTSAPALNAADSSDHAKEGRDV